MHTLFLLGDSTCAQKSPEVYPETGWGMCFAPYLKRDWNLVNLAINGRSTKQFIEEGSFTSALDSMQKDDYCIIQFGHNENKDDEVRHTDPWTSYYQNLTYMIKEILGKKANPILISSITRRNFLDVKYLMHTLGEYPKAMKTVAEELQIPFIDMTTPTRKIISDLGSLDSKQFFMHFPAGLYPQYPNGCADDTHLRPEGARMVAELTAKLLIKHYPELPFLT